MVGEGPSRKKCRPRGAVIEVILDPPTLSSPAVPASCRQDCDVTTSQIVPECGWHSVTKLSAREQFNRKTTTASSRNPPMSLVQENTSARMSKTVPAADNNPPTSSMQAAGEFTYWRYMQLIWLEGIHLNLVYKGEWLDIIGWRANFG